FRVACVYSRNDSSRERIRRLLKYFNIFYMKIIRIIRIIHFGPIEGIIEMVRMSGFLRICQKRNRIDFPVESVIYPIKIAKHALGEIFFIFILYFCMNQDPLFFTIFQKHLKDLVRDCFATLYLDDLLMHLLL